MKQEQPIICRFFELTYALQRLHQWQKPLIDDLHDIWLKGAPTPDSRILLPNHYDPRVPQNGNTEKRIVFPTLLAAWIKDVAAKRGVAMSVSDAQKLVGAIQKAWERKS